MKELLNILILEDSIDDVELILMILQRAELSNIYSVVSNRAEFESEIQHHSFDLIISDLNLGQFNCFDALKLLNGTPVPFIVISGMIPPESLELLKEKEIPYLYKDNLKGLPEMIIKVLDEKKTT